MQQVVNVYPALLDHTMTGRPHITVLGAHQEQLPFEEEPRSGHNVKTVRNSIDRV